jgi:catechol 2,3-dioxygenase-like lactoylglutathione lyase family enzyme
MLNELERLVGLYDEGGLSRRQLLHGLFALGIGRYVAGPLAGGVVHQEQAAPFHTRTLNHVTLYTSNVARSKAFYQRLTGLPIQAEDKDFCEFGLEDSFLGIYAIDAGQQPGFNHFCFGIDGYEPQATLAALKAAVPDAQPTLQGQSQVYVLDPDGVRVQFADVNYKG